MKLTVLDAETLGSDVSMGVFSSLGELTVYANTAPDEIVAHIGDAEVVLLNKIHLDEAVLKHLPCLRLICIAATGYDNIDVEYCRKEIVEKYGLTGVSAVVPGGKERYWDQVPLEFKKENYSLYVRECSFDDITEIDSYNELKKLDSSYSV